MRNKTLKLNLSIVIPAYNEEHHLRACLDSIAAQTEAPNEVIVVDNNSTDKTAAIARSYHFVRLMSEQQQGIAHAHHAGFAQSTGQYIARIDADSVLPVSWVRDIGVFYKNPDNRDTSICGSGYAKNLRARWLHQQIMDGLFIATKLFLGFAALWGPNCVIPRTAWREIAPKTCSERPTTYDDLDIALHLHQAGLQTVWLRSLRVGVRIKHVKSPVRFWRYVQRWSGTLRNHGDKRWPIAWVVAAAIFILDYPLIRVSYLQENSYV